MADGHIFLNFNWQTFADLYVYVAVHTYYENLILHIGTFNYLKGYFDIQSTSDYYVYWYKPNESV